MFKEQHHKRFASKFEQVIKDKNKNKNINIQTNKY